MIIAVPFVLPTLLPLVVAFFWLRHHYITTGREVKRFDATTRSPVYASFSAALKVCCPVTQTQANTCSTATLVCVA